MENMEIILKNSPIIEQLREGQEVTWLNPDKISFTEASKKCELHQEDVEDAERRFVRFAPLIQKYFLETIDKGGLIESPLIRIDTMKQSLCETSAYL